jgi:phytoene dehydrogenase-like protein
MSKKIIVIGAGIAGLSAATYLQMSGFDTEIYEMHDLPGGLCTTWERKGYNIDGCIHWLIGTKQGSTLNKMWNEIIDINSMNFSHFEHYGTFTDKQGNSINVYTDPDKLETELLSIAPEDEIPIKKFCNILRKFKDFDPPADITPEIMSGKEKMAFMFKILRYMPDLNKYLKISLKEFAANFKNPLLQFAFKNLFVPEMSLIFVIINFAWFNRGNAAYPIGGSLNFARLIEKSFLEAGGKINYKSKVEKIIVENTDKEKKATGILLADGKKIDADIVISAADVHFTLKNMLEDKFTSEKWQKRFTDFDTFSSFIQVSIGIDGKLDYASQRNQIEIKTPLKVTDKDTIKTFNYRIHDFDPTLAPEGKTLITTLIEVKDYQYWTELRTQDRKAYRHKKKEIAEFIIAEIEKHTGKFSDKIEMLDISTPATVIRYTNNWRGSYEGWIMNAKAGFSSFERQLPGLDNFYLAGQWIEPGGGIPTAFMSGRNLARIICNENGYEFLKK